MGGARSSFPALHGIVRRSFFLLENTGGVRMMDEGQSARPCHGWMYCPNNGGERFNPDTKLQLFLSFSLTLLFHDNVTNSIVHIM